VYTPKTDAPAIGVSEVAVLDADEAVLAGWSVK
jgi:hypothetical protein